MDSNVKMAVMIIEEYIADLSYYNNGKFHKEYFKQYSYSKWAAGELITDILNNPDTHPLFTIEDFIRKMDKFSCVCGHRDSMFSVAYDVGYDIYDIFLSAI